MRNNFHMRDLHYLVMVAEELHFGKAAERAGIAQPQLSEVIRRVEDVWKVSIFTRRPRVRMTPAGSILIDMVRRVLAEIDRELDHARAVAAGRIGTVKLGLPPATMLTTIPTLLQNFRSAHPEVTLSLTESDSSALWEMLERREVDLIISRELRPDTNARNYQIVNDKLMLIVPETHRFAQRDVVSLTELADENFVFFRRSAAPSYYDRIVAACHALGLYMTAMQEADSSSAILALVGAGFGISFAAANASRVRYPGVVYISIAEQMPSAIFWLSFFEEGLPPSAQLVVAEFENACRSATVGEPAPHDGLS